MGNGQYNEEEEGPGQAEVDDDEDEPSSDESRAESSSHTEGRAEKRDLCKNCLQIGNCLLFVNNFFVPNGTNFC